MQKINNNELTLKILHYLDRRLTVGVLNVIHGRVDQQLTGPSTHRPPGNLPIGQSVPGTYLCNLIGSYGTVL